LQGGFRAGGETANDGGLEVTVDEKADLTDQ